jgi:RNA polymerase sigma factor (sigma-70 family)
VERLGLERRPGLAARHARGPGAPTPSAIVDQNELRDRIADAIAALPEREKLVIALYYYENLTLREIGEVLGVTESRVSQLHTKAVLRLRSLGTSSSDRPGGELDRFRERRVLAPRRARSASYR